MIRKGRNKNQYTILSESGKKMGTYKTKKEAKKRLQQITTDRIL